MPAFLPPRQSTVHRTAAIALYRALLTQCRAAPVNPKQRDELQNIVRNRFKESRHSQSIRRLRVSFEAGYEAIDHLDAAVSGSEDAKRYIVGLLGRAPAKAKEAPVMRPPSVKVKVKVTQDEEDGESGNHKERVSLFDRPLPLEQLSGRRHLPVLFNANHIPVLRLKKPQPATLSRYIRQRVTQRQARHNLRFRLYDELKLAAYEDEWDELIADSTEPAQAQGVNLDQVMLASKTKGIEGASRWTDAIETSIREVHGKLNEERQKNRVMAEKMQAIVDRERELYEQEKAQRKEVKRAEKLKRREERRVDVGHVTDAEQKEGKIEPMAKAR